MIAIFIMWMISFIGIIIWGKRPYIVNKIDVELPQTFLKLNSEFQKNHWIGMEIRIKSGILNSI